MFGMGTGVSPTLWSPEKVETIEQKEAKEGDRDTLPAAARAVGYGAVAERLGQSITAFPSPASPLSARAAGALECAPRPE